MYPSSDKSEIFSLSLSLCCMWLPLMSVWEGGEADLCPGFLFFFFFPQLSSAGLVRWIAKRGVGGELQERLTRPVGPVFFFFCGGESSAHKSDFTAS